MGWLLGSLGELHKQGRGPVPPTAIIPLGTGNDLSRSFGWVSFSVYLGATSQFFHFFLVILRTGSLISFQGGSLPFNWRSATKRTLDKASTAPTCRLDR